MPPEGGSWACWSGVAPAPEARGVRLDVAFEIAQVEHVGAEAIDGLVAGLRCGDVGDRHCAVGADIWWPASS